MRNNRLTGIALAVGLILPLAACSGGSSDNSDELVVQSIWTKGTAEGDALAKMIKEFTAETGTKVTWLDTGESLADVFETSVAGGSEADIVLTNLAEKTNNWVTNGAVVDMAPYIDQWGLTDSFKPDTVDQWKDSDGKLIGLPYSGFTWPAWYNMDLLKQVGVDEVPATTDELIDLAGKLRDAGIAPMSIGGNDWTGQKLFLQIAQMYATPEVAHKTFQEGDFCAQPDIKKGVALFTQLRDAGVFIDDAEGYSADAMNTQYYTGKAAIMSAGSWAFGSADLSAETAAATKLSGFPLPSGSSWDKPTAYNGYTGVGVLLSKNGAKKADAAGAFIKMLYSDDTITDFVSTANLIPAVESEAKSTNPLLSQAVTDLDARVDYAVMPDTAVPGAVADPMIRATSIAFAPGNDVDTICKAIDDAYASAG
ncbi:multiple sugar transport system substrate-binding protein [Sanguibacter gelidistatuariae]|uniref:Multiple sugar transport system substrate-binding protein n=1 Tax=Sanguibacter gelidistatuariae TaxID=1814289 RepID=A0A1G6GVY9_9MICO|nr:ABC transporter substrate-binding protein [Sanguibacter gelidistatuariae]SDB85845.1 multiple sugar transport system substrate-binding protein [Sanguibacter gelidistatuariae]